MTLQDRSNLQTEEIQERDRDEELSPQGYLEVELEDVDRDQLQNWLKDHLDQIKSQMDDTLQRFESEENRFEGNVPVADYPYAGAFRLTYPITKKKVREITNRIRQAFLSSDPIWGINWDNPALFDLAQKVERSMDQLVDEDAEALDDIAQAMFECILHGSGFVVPGWTYEEDTFRDIETYKGWDGRTREGMADVLRFEENYPDFKEEPEAEKIWNKLRRGQDVEMEVKYQAPIKNSPHLKFVEAKKVRVYPKVDGYTGLRMTPAYGYMETWTRMELDAAAEAGQIEKTQLDKIVNAPADSDQKDAREEVEEFEIFMGTIRYQLPGDDIPVRYQVWMEENGTLLRIRGFQWWYSRPDLIPFYCRDEEPGFFKKGIAWDLKDTHIGLTVFYNLLLNAIDMASSMRWIVKKNSPAENYLLSRRWSPHLPLPYRNLDEKPESAATPTNHIAAIVQGFEIQRRTSDEDTQTSNLQSGRESPTDPNAPATKTLILLQQVEPGTKEIIRSLAAGMKESGRWLMWLYYQAIKLEWIEAIPGLEDIPKSMLRKAVDKLGPRAILFEFDRQGRLDRNLAMLQIIKEHYPNRPDLISKAIRIVIQQTDSQWNKLADSLDLTMEPQAPAPGAPPGGGPASPTGPRPPRRLAAPGASNGVNSERGAGLLRGAGAQ